jgi:hypothetical protein
MKKTLTLLATLALALSASAQTLNLTYGYVTKRANGATNAEVIFPAGSGSTIARLVSLDVTSDAAGGILKLQGGTYDATISVAALSTATNCAVLGNSYIVAGDTVVFQKADGTVFSAAVDSTNAVTNINLTAQIGTALAAGDKVYRMGLLATNTIGAATVRKEGPAIFAARLRSPIRLLSYGATTATAINSATVAYGSTPEN